VTVRLNSGFAIFCAAQLVTGFVAFADTTNAAGATVAPPAPASEATFRIVSERNIFNANRSGGTVRSSSSRRPVRVDSFALTGTMAYDKGAFAFFEGSSSEFTKVLKPQGVIAGHKLVDILANSVKLELNGSVIELAIGGGFRREDQGEWKATENVSAALSNNESRSSRRADRDNSNGDASNASTASSPEPAADQSEVLRKLMERRAKENE
jgi:hypothetical protein